jgi:hypothetical protein
MGLGGSELRFGRLVFACVGLLLVSADFAPLRAVEAVVIRPNTPALDLMPAAERHTTEGDRLQVSTAPGADGIVRRIEVRARNASGVTHWAVFALSNNTDEQLDRLLVAPNYLMSRRRAHRQSHAESGLPPRPSERVRRVRLSDHDGPRLDRDLRGRTRIE